MAGKAGGQKLYVYKEARLLALWAKIGLAYSAAADLIAAVVFLATPGERFTGAETSALTRGQAFQALASVVVFLGVFLMVPFLIWLYRVSANAKSLKPSYGRSVWAVYFWYFVPIAGLMMPYFVMAEIWHASSGSRARAAPKGSLLLLQIWWGLMLFRGMGGIAARLVLNNVFDAVIYLAGAVMAVCLCLIVGRLQKMQSDTHLARTFDDAAPAPVLEAQTA